MRFNVRRCACLIVCKYDALEASAGDRHCWVDITEERVKLQRKGSGVLRAVCKCHRAELGKRCGPVTPKAQALSLGRPSCNCFQSLLSGSRKPLAQIPTACSKLG